jgi:hypothetical protein
MRGRFKLKRKDALQPLRYTVQTGDGVCDLIRISDSEAAEKLRRLAVFQKDLSIALLLLKFARENSAFGEGADEGSQTMQESLYDAALIAFLRCFESTAGVRVQPLSPKKIFVPVDRVKFKKLVAIRNKIVAHDEQIFGSVEVFVGRKIDFHAAGTATMVTSVTFFGMHEATSFEDLVKTAFSWTEKEADHLKAKIIEQYEALPLETRMALQPFVQKFEEAPLPF